MSRPKKKKKFAIKGSTFEVKKVTPDSFKSLLQWNLRIKDTLGARLLSFIRRLSSGGRFDSIYYF